ncbi:hypothetical protein CHELA1G11_10742 [Hyphomicrobiales bacterium]|nr:hypothetical protein CHELA1G11_10742 [Hyphomicrobiales bacterium]CAH1672562.1 hypothetical protein CHELA1G2_13564 [Hyphomicrobiales bacterium]
MLHPWVGSVRRGACRVTGMRCGSRRSRLFIEAPIVTDESVEATHNVGGGRDHNRSAAAPDFAQAP